MMSIDSEDCVFEMIFKLPPPNRPCVGCDKTNNEGCEGGIALCERCGQEFEVIPQKFNIMHLRKACFIPPHNALCGRGCYPRGISYIGFIPHFDMKSCDICKRMK